MPYSVRYSHTYSFGFSCILDEVKKCTDFAYFLAGGWGGGGSDPRIPYSGVRREYMVLSVFWPYSVRILPNHRIRRIRTEYGLLTAPYTRTTAADQSCIRVHTGTLPAAAPHTANRSGLERYRQRRCAHRSSPVTATDSVTRHLTAHPQPIQCRSCANNNNPPKRSVSSRRAKRYM